MFDKFIGVDYSGAGEPRAANPHIAVAVSETNGQTAILQRTDAVHPLCRNAGLSRQQQAKWSREAVYLFLRNELLQSRQRVIVGIDHGFSYPAGLLQDLHIRNWDDFLSWFRLNWKTVRYTVDFCMKQAPYLSSTEKRLVEKEFTPSAKGVVDLDRKGGRQGAVSFSTHAGIPWIYRLRRLQQAKKIKVHFWPFDGIVIDDDSHVIFEGYPAVYKRRVAMNEAMNEHERDADAIATWLRERDAGNTLQQYLTLPTLTGKELELSRLEGWILGCL